MEVICVNDGSTDKTLDMLLDYQKKDKRIYVFERASQYMLLDKVPNTFMWISPIPDEMLEDHGLIEKKCEFAQKKYKDVLIYRDDYKLTELDKMFIKNVQKAKEGIH